MIIIPARNVDVMTFVGSMYSKHTHANVIFYVFNFNCSRLFFLIRRALVPSKRLLAQAHNVEVVTLNDPIVRTTRVRDTRRV